MRKKLLVPIAALLLASSGCTKHDLLSNNLQATGNNVSFHAYTGKTGKITPTTDKTFNTFRVYAYQGATDISWADPTKLMTDVEVIKGTNAWEATAPTPWPAEGTNVQFFAFSPKAEAIEGGSTITYNAPAGNFPTLTMTTATNVEKQQDLLFAQTNKFPTAAKDKHQKVSLNFKHALSKFRFSAKVQPNQILFIDSVSICNLSNTGTLAYAATPSEGYTETANWSDDDTKNRAFKIKLTTEASGGLTNSDKAISITEDDGAPLVIPQKRDKVDVTAGGKNIFTGQNQRSYIKITYSLQNTTTQDWIVGSANEKKETYIPVDIDFSINKAYNFSV
ncbi:MAG: fimbrillin family protein, partial [Phocaeicola sp.]